MQWLAQAGARQAATGSTGRTGTDQYQLTSTRTGTPSAPENATAAASGPGQVTEWLSNSGAPAVTDSDTAHRLLKLPYDDLRRPARGLIRRENPVQLRFFSSLENDWFAEVLGISTATVQRDSTLARAWLHRDLGSTEVGLIWPGAPAHGSAGRPGVCWPSTSDPPYARK